MSLELPACPAGATPTSVSDPRGPRRPYDASVFETTIRVMGGLLTAYELSDDRMFLTRCESGSGNSALSTQPNRCAGVALGVTSTGTKVPAIADSGHLVRSARGLLKLCAGPKGGVRRSASAASCVPPQTVDQRLDRVVWDLLDELGAEALSDASGM